MRCAVIEVSGNMISDLIQQEEQTETTKSQVDGFFDLLEERVLDVNPYCRSRIFQVYLRLLKYYLYFQVGNSLACRQNSRKGGSAFASFAFGAWRIKAAM